MPFFQPRWYCLSTILPSHLLYPTIFPQGQTRPWLSCVPLSHKQVLLVNIYEWNSPQEFLQERLQFYPFTLGFYVSVHQGTICLPVHAAQPRSLYIFRYFPEAKNQVLHALSNILLSTQPAVYNYCLLQLRFLQTAVRQQQRFHRVPPFTMRISISKAGWCFASAGFRSLGNKWVAQEFHCRGRDAVYSWTQCIPSELISLACSQIYHLYFNRELVQLLLYWSLFLVSPMMSQIT